MSTANAVSPKGIVIAPTRTHSDEVFDLLARILHDVACDTEPLRDEPEFQARLAAADRLWRHLPSEAHYHGVVALVAPPLGRLARASQLDEAPHARRALLALVAMQRSAVAARERCVSDVLAAMHARQVQAVLLKGAALAHLLYVHPEDRPSLDIDILVDPRQLPDAQAAARAVGFVFAEDHASRFAPRMNHLPEASLERDGIRIALEIHVDALAPTRRGRLSLANLRVPLQEIDRGAEIAGMALGPADMLRHLAHHTFEPSQRIRLVHLFDLWRYGARVGDPSAGQTSRDRIHLRAALAMAALVFEPREGGGRAKGIGQGLQPLSGLARIDGIGRKASALLLPSEWWLRGFYGIPPGRALGPTRFVGHPLTLARWVCARYLARSLRGVGPARVRLRA